MYVYGMDLVDKKRSTFMDTDIFEITGDSQRQRFNPDDWSQDKKYGVKVGQKLHRFVPFAVNDTMVGLADIIKSQRFIIKPRKSLTPLTQDVQKFEVVEERRNVADDRLKAQKRKGQEEQEVDAQLVKLAKKSGLAGSEGISANSVDKKTVKKHKKKSNVNMKAIKEAEMGEDMMLAKKVQKKSMVKSPVTSSPVKRGNLQTSAGDLSLIDWEISLVDEVGETSNEKRDNTEPPSVAFLSKKGDGPKDSESKSNRPENLAKKDKEENVQYDAGSQGCESCGKTTYCSTIAYNKMKQYIRKSNEEILRKLEVIARQTSIKPSEVKHCKLQDLRDVCPGSEDYDIPNGMVHIGEKNFVSIKDIATVDIEKQGVRSRLVGLVPLFWPGNTYKDYSLDGKGNKQITDYHIKSMIGILECMTWKVNHNPSLEIGNVRRELSKALSHLKRPTASKQKKKVTKQVKKNSDTPRGNNKPVSECSESSDEDDEDDEDDDDDEADENSKEERDKKVKKNKEDSESSDEEVDNSKNQKEN